MRTILPEAAPGVTPAAELTLEEIEEQQLAEDARINSGDWNAIAPGKAQDFGRSFRRMIGLLAPWKWSFAFVSLLGAIGVILTVIAPKVLGEATNLIFEGVISAQLPAGVTQDQVVEQLRAAGQNDLANIVAAATITVARTNWVSETQATRPEPSTSTRLARGESRTNQAQMRVPSARKKYVENKTMKNPASTWVIAVPISLTWESSSPFLAKSWAAFCAWSR